MAVATPATVLNAARYLGCSAKGLQTCIDRGYNALQTARYLGQDKVAIQRAFVKFQILSLGVTVAGKVATATISGSTPSGTVAVTWGDAGSDNVVCDASGNGTKTHTYATAATFTVNASQGGRNAAPVSITTT